MVSPVSSTATNIARGGGGGSSDNNSTENGAM